MNTSMALIPSAQFAVPSPTADWSRKLSGDGGDGSDSLSSPRFELPETTTDSNSIVSPDSRALNPRSDRTDAEDVQRTTTQGTKDIEGDSRTKPRRAADQKSAKSDADQANSSVNPWVQGQPATDTADAGADSASGGTAGDSEASKAAVKGAADGTADSQAATGTDASAAASPLARIMNLWSQTRSSAQAPVIPTPGAPTASADGAPSGAITVTVTSASQAAATVAPQSTNAVAPQSASAQSVATLLQMLGGVADDVAAAATQVLPPATAASESGSDRATAVSATAVRVDGLVSFLLSAMPGGGKSGDNRKEDSGFKDLLAMLPSANTPTNAVPDVKVDALLAGIQGLAVSPHTGGGTSGAAADSTSAVNQPPLTLNSPGWEDSLSDRVHMLLHTTADGEVNEARIQLHPREMGSIQIHVRMGSEGADVRFAATNPDVRHALEASLPRLRELLSAGGTSLSQAQVGSQLSQNSQQTHAQARSASAAPMAGANTVSDDETAGARRIRIASVSLIDDYA